MLHTLLHTVYFLVIILAPIVFIHEMGHYLATKVFGGAVERFSIGFGRVLWSRKDSSGTEWCISAVPIGGYIKPVYDPIENLKGKSLHQLNRFQQIIIMAAGPAANFVLAIALYTIIFLHVGIPHGITTIESVAQHSPAATAGIRAGDSITQINGVHVSNALEAMEAFSTNVQPNVYIQIKRNNITQNILVHAEKVKIVTPDGRTIENERVGITMKRPENIHPGIIPTVIYATDALYKQVYFSLESFIQIVSGHRSTTNMRGMIGLAQESNHITYNWIQQLEFAASISIGLGVANLLPISTILDGGKILILSIESVIRRNIPKRAEKAIELLSLGVILLLLLVTTGQDLFFLLFGHAGHG